jgi:hypothetical protein
MEAEAAKRRAAIRQEVVDKMRREQFQAHMRDIERRGRERDDANTRFDLSPEREKINAESRRLDAEKRARCEKMWRENEVAEGKARFARSLSGSGAEGFTVKR